MSSVDSPNEDADLFAASLGKALPVLDNLSSMVGYWDKNLINRFSNKAYLSWFGKSAQDLLGKHIKDLLGEDLFALNLPYIQAVLRGEPQKFERIIPTPDKTDLRYSLAEYIPDIVDGEVRGFFVQVSDISELKNAEESVRLAKNKLSQSEERYQAVIENQTEVISRLYTDGTLVYVNEAYENLFGKSDSELIGEKYKKLVFPDDIDSVEAKLRSLTATNPIVNIENRVIANSGEIHWMEFRNQGSFDAAGHLLAIQSVGRNIDDRKRVEQALGISEERLKLALEYGEIGVWDLDLINDTAWRSLKHDQIFGYEFPPEKWGMEVALLHVIEEDREKFIHAFQAAYETGELEFECRVQWLDQSEHWIQVRGRVIRDHLSQPIRMMGTVIDITARKLVNDAYRSLFENMLNSFTHCRMIFEKGAPIDYEILQVNPAHEQVTGQKDTVGKKVSELIPNYFRDNAESLEVFGQVALTGVTTRWEHYLAAWDKWFNFVIYSPKRGEFVLLTEDITERKRTEQELRILATAFESHEGMIITDANTNILRVNHAFTTITGYAAEEVIGKKPNVLSSGRHDKNFYRAMWESLQDIGSWDGEIWNKRKSGEIYPEHLTITAVRNQTGLITHYVGALTDSTERQNVLVKLRNTATNLELANLQIESERANLAQRVEERTAQLKYANNAKDSFLATMSHEVRTPLGGLMGMMELLDMTNLEPKQRALLNTARESAGSLLRIVNDILDWSKIEAGKLEMVAQPSSINTLLEGVRNTYEHVATTKHITLQYYCDVKLSTAHQFDRLRVAQIINNLTSNAIKFTDHGGVELRAEQVSRQGDWETVCFSVKDTGIGISTEQQSRIFQQYEQASNQTARMYGGTGLGLAISHRLAEMMGGKLGVESTPGQGSTFSLTVALQFASVADPLALQQSILENDNGKGELDLTPLFEKGRVIRTLVVDDHPVNRMLLKHQLELLGLELEVADSGRSALSLWQKQHFDLVITDCHMPEMDGYELTRKIRELEQQTKSKRTPIIAWTANVLADEIERCNAAGMDDMLTKPTEFAGLKATLLKWLV
ncbi:MAG: PAS domain S-box protein [Gallionella sp.]|nr:PAS domain S-box protein [Gallionella sp.]